MAIGWRQDANGNMVAVDQVGKESMYGPDDSPELESPINRPTRGVVRPIKPAILPRPDSSFMIVQQGTRKALAAGKKPSGDAGRMKLAVEQRVWAVPHAHVVWECIMGRDHYSFRNRANGLVLCHDGKGNLHLADPEAEGFTSFVCRVIVPMPEICDGGSKVMILDYWANHRHLEIMKDTNEIVAPTRDHDVHGADLWKFMLVKNYIPTSFYK